MKNKRTKTLSKRLCTATLSLGLLLSCMACASSSPQPGVKIIEPVNPAAGDVTISVKVTGISEDSDGHIIYYLDESAPIYYDHSAVSKAGTYAISEETSYIWKGVTPGEHKFSVQLVDKNSSPLPEPAVDSVTVQVGAPNGAPKLDITNLAEGDSLPPGNILVVIGTENFIVSREHMGVINRLGEGHLIYYIDEDPPTDTGVPATTDTSMVSTAESHLWKNVTEGKHTFSVQLVNNDDTPLDTPIAATVTIDVKP